MSAKPLSRELSTALCPLLFVLQGCRKLSRVPRASCFRIRHRFTRRPFRAQLPPPSCHSLGYLRSLDPSLFVDDPPCRPCLRRIRMKALATTVGTWQGSIIMATAPFPLDFHLLSSPPRLHANTPDGQTPLFPLSRVWFMAARVRATTYAEITVWDFIRTNIISSRESLGKHRWFRLRLDRIFFTKLKSIKTFSPHHCKC